MISEPSAPSSLPGSRSSRVRLDWQPVGRRVEVEPGTSLLAAARAAGVELVAICGGVGACEGCRVRVRGAGASPATDTERRTLGTAAVADGWRLACQAVAEDDLTIDVPPESLTTPQRLQIEGQSLDITPDPVVRHADVALRAPDLDDLRPDLGRLSDAVAAVTRAPLMAGTAALDQAATRLRAQDWSARVALRGVHLVSVLPRDARLVGLAIDLGTTKIAAYLVDLGTGRTLASAGRMNPQVALGEDVISRIAYAGHDRTRRRELQALVVETLNDVVGGLVAEAGVERAAVVDAVLVGNTAMHHLAAGLPVASLGEAPYVSVVATPLEIAAGELGLELAPGAVVYFPPNIAGYVGSDHVAMLLETIAGGATGTAIAVDIGTNTEMTVSRGGRMWTCSCASGPAFEGAHISQGMRAAPGAIERVRIIGDEVRVHTIGGQPASGICGSGILDAVAELHRTGILDRHGALRGRHPAVQLRERGPELLLVPAAATAHGRDVTVTRRDVNEIQLAKAAIRAGLDVLLAESGVASGDVDRVVVAGAFGTYLDIASAVAIGLLPALPSARVEQVGNAAGAGARAMLVSGPARRQAESLARATRYVELTTHPAFADAFARAVCF